MAVARIVEVCLQRLTVPLHQPAAGPPPRTGEEWVVYTSIRITCRRLPARPTSLKPAFSNASTNPMNR